MKYLKKALPHIVAIIIFAAISALFFAPQYSGKALRQGDMIQASGMGQDIVEHQEKYDEHPQWAGNMFGGMPSYLISMNYEGRWIKNIADHTYILGQPASLIFIAMATFYLMLLMFGVNPWVSIIGGIAYGLSTYFPIIIEAGHITKMMALAWIPAVIGSVYYAYRKNWLLGAALAGLFLSIEISTSHPQITYYFAFVILALFINEFVRAHKEKTYKKFTITTLALLCAAGLAVGSNAVQLYYVADYSKDTIRGKNELSILENPENATSGLNKDYATSWSYGKAESFNMFIPNFEGGGRNFSTDGDLATVLGKYQVPSEAATYFSSYHGPQPFTEGPVYIGAVMVFLFVFGMFYLRGSAKWWIAGVSLLALLLAWGNNFGWLTNLFLDYFPLYNKFRTVSMILVVLEWSIPLLAILALNALCKKEEESGKRFNNSLKYSLIITGGFAIIAALIIPSFMDFSSPSDLRTIGAIMGINVQDPQYTAFVNEITHAMWEERASMLRSDAFRSLIFVALTAGCIWLLDKGKIKQLVAVGAIALLTTIDLYQVDRRFVKLEDFQPKREAMAIKPTQFDTQILQDQSNYRVANFAVGTFEDATTSYFHRSVGGYHAAKLRRYNDIIEKHLSKNNMAVYDMLNTKYFITPEGVHLNESAAGSAWFVPGIKWVDNADEEIAALGEDFDPHAEAIIDKRFKAEIETTTINAIDSTTQIELVDYKVNHLTYEYNTPHAGVVVFSEIYYPKGWTACIDGKEADYVRANYILRAMEVPAGTHTIEWKFAAPHFKTLVNTTKASSAILIMLTLAGIIISFRRKNE